MGDVGYAFRERREYDRERKAQVMADNLTKTAPPRIWLQVDYSSVGDRSDPFPDDLDGITWCKDSVGGLEVEYVRADHSEDRWLDGYYEGFKEANRLAYQSPGKRWMDHEPTLEDPNKCCPACGGKIAIDNARKGGE